MSETQALPREDAALERPDVYGLLALCLQAPPRPELADTLLRFDVEPLGDAALTRHFERFVGELGAASAEDLEREYNRLLVGMPAGEVTPYESWYLSGHVMDHPLAELRRDLRRLGIERQAHNREPEDHAAAVCECMATLEALDMAEPDARRTFFARHVDSWLPRLFEQIARASCARVYAELARLGLAFLAHERRVYGA